MLFPQQNRFRHLIDLSGVWSFSPDSGSVGEALGWPEGVPGNRLIAVPASWNEQHHDLRDYLGDAWYQTQFDVPPGWEAKRVFLRFGSVNYLADVWLNGVHLGQHEGGHLPFEYEIGPHLHPEHNILVVRVNGMLAPDRVPPGNLTANTDWHDSFGNIEFPASNFDFFPYCGIHRPVLLYALPTAYIADITVNTSIQAGAGKVHAHVECTGVGDGLLYLTLRGHGIALVVTSDIRQGHAEAEISVSQPALWSPEHPALYDMVVEIVRDDVVIDRYTLPVGIRTIEVTRDQLLLNGKPVVLRGFGLHEDFPVFGRGVVPVLAVKDLHLMKWAGANSFRTSHYPYAEETLFLADQLGLMVIAETPAVGLFFDENGLDQRQTLWHQQTETLIKRDKNHPSVIMWSLANEPHNHRPKAREAFDEIFATARALDSTRPCTYTTYIGVNDPAVDLCDVVCLNRYRGWYSEVGQIEQGVDSLERELAETFERLQRPIMVSEFGADAVAGHHADPPEMFSEEYQAAFLEAYHKLFSRLPFLVGEHVWALCDFKTNQSVRRVGALNLKGVFTRDRRPKLAAHVLRRVWAEDRQ